MECYWITIGDGRSTEALVAAGDYGYAHSCVTSDNFPVRRPDTVSMREVVLLEFAQGVTSEEAVAEATRLGLERPIYEDALAFGAAYPSVQVERPVVFLHDPWFGFFGRRGTSSRCGAMPGAASSGSRDSKARGTRTGALASCAPSRGARCPNESRARPRFPGTMRAQCAIRQHSTA